MVIASPNNNTTNSLMNAYYEKMITYCSPGSGDIGFRPVVCLNNGTKLQRNPDNLNDGEDETYSIISPIEATAEYDEDKEKITVNITSMYGVENVVDEDGITLGRENCTTVVVGTAENKNEYTFIITDKKGNTKKLEVKIERKVYATLYTDGTLAFASNERKIA